MLVSLNDLDNDSKVWIYQSDKRLTDEQVISLKEDLFNFLTDWTSHNVQLYTSGDVLYNTFVILMVDERSNSTGGCSIDKSVHFIEFLESKYGINLLERMNMAYLDDNNRPGDPLLNIVSLNDLNPLYKDGIINDNTIVFDNLVRKKSDFETRWKIPLSQSWHNRFI